MFLSSEIARCHRQFEALFNRGYVPDATINGMLPVALPIAGLGLPPSDG